MLKICAPWELAQSSPKSLRSAMHHAPISAKFHHARPNDEREKLQNFFTPFSILAPQGNPWAKV